MIHFLMLMVGIAFAGSAYAEDGWKSEAEAGVVLTSGNTETSTVSAKEETSYQFSRNILKLTGSYLYQKTSDVLSAKSWSLGIRYERLVSDRLSFFVAQSVSGDRFKGIRQAYSTDLGAKYFLVKNDDFYWFGEAGYRFMREQAFTYEKNKNLARVYTELEKKWNET